MQLHSQQSILRLSFRNVATPHGSDKNATRRPWRNNSYNRRVATPHGSDKNATCVLIDKLGGSIKLQLPTGQIKMQLFLTGKPMNGMSHVATPHGSDKNATFDRVLGNDISVKVATPHGSDKNATIILHRRHAKYFQLQLPTGQIKMQRD